MIGVVGQIVAQASGGTGISDFAGQIGGILAVTVASFVAWIVLTVVILQRAQERRRRKREGLPPLPSFYAVLWARLQGRELPTGAGLPKPERKQKPATPAHKENIPLPALDDLTADLPTPDLADLTAPLDEPPAFATTPTPPPLPLDEFQLPDEEMVAAVGTAAAMIQQPSISTQTDYVPYSGTLPSDAVEVLRVWRDVSDGTLILGMRNQLFATVDEMTDVETAKRFIALVKELAQMATAGAYAAGLTPPSFTQTSQVVSKPGDWYAAQKPVTPDVPPPMADDLPGEMGLADQIEMFLQARLAATPQLAKRSIHVLPAQDGGVKIEVDGRYYAEVDDVMDADVRDFLRQTIKAWEERS